MLNLSTLKTPGVKIDEVPKFPPSIAAVETAIPAFIGYTEKAPGRVAPEGGDGGEVPPPEVVIRRITSMVEYIELFGETEKETNLKVTISDDGKIEVKLEDSGPSTKHLMYYALRMFYSNGGGPCFIVSVGGTTGTISKDALKRGLDEIALEDEPTILCFPEAIALGATFNTLMQDALQQCEALQDRFTIMDVKSAGNIDTDAATFRGVSGTIDQLKYGASYYPYLTTTLNYLYDEADVSVVLPSPGGDGGDGDGDGGDGDGGASMEDQDNETKNKIKAKLKEFYIDMPPSSTMAGIYAAVDAARGVWKAPANVSLNAVIKPTVKINDEAQKGLNVDPTAGKSINAIRAFTGKGNLVWGARTLAGNDNEWRYINVRRFFNFVEESTKKGTERFVFEPNDANTWVKVKAMIENFLTLQWRAGALQGAKPEHAFYVSVGLGETMSADDVLNGRMIVEIGMAVVRPAEFIVLRFMHKLPES